MSRLDHGYEPRRTVRRFNTTVQSAAGAGAPTGANPGGDVCSRCGGVGGGPPARVDAATAVDVTRRGAPGIRRAASLRADGGRT